MPLGCCSELTAVETLLSELLELRREDPPAGGYEPRGGRKVADWSETLRRTQDWLRAGGTDLRVAGYWVDAIARTSEASALRVALGELHQRLERDPAAWLPLDEGSVDREGAVVALEFMDRVIAQCIGSQREYVEVECALDGISAALGPAIAPMTSSFSRTREALSELRTDRTPAPTPGSSATRSSAVAASSLAPGAGAVAGNPVSQGRVSLRDELRRQARDLFDREPCEALSYRLTRALAWEVLPATPRAPTDESRNRLETAFAAEDWQSVVIAAELLLWSDTPWWLEAQRLELHALDRLGLKWERAKAAVERELIAVVREHRDLRSGRLATGEPLIGPELARWVDGRARHQPAAPTRDATHPHDSAGGLFDEALASAHERGAHATLEFLSQKRPSSLDGPDGVEWGLALTEVLALASAPRLAATVVRYLHRIVRARVLWTWLPGGQRALLARRVIELSSVEPLSSDLEPWVMHEPIEALVAQGAHEPERNSQ
ncbi:MAG: type VI secretion system domain-containing protein [Planctomycetota bacterium]